MIEKELKLQLEEAINNVESLIMDITMYGDDTDKSLAIISIDKIRLILNKQSTTEPNNSDKTEQLNIADVSNHLFKDEITKIALEKYPIQMGSIGDEKEWDKNEQYRECWIEGYMYFLNCI